jgi:hypothetical protein
MSYSRPADEAAIQAVLVDSYKAWEAGDAAGMVANYAADATAIMTGSLRDVGRDAAIVISESGILFPAQTEVPDTGKVNATWVFEKRDGKWLIAAYHNSPVLAPVQ